MRVVASAALATPAVRNVAVPAHTIDVGALNIQGLWCGDCLDCIFYYGHEFFQNGYGPKAGGYHGCFIGEPCVHGACGLGAARPAPDSAPGRSVGDEYLAIRETLVQGGPPAVAAAVRLIRRYPDRASYNPDRGAIQITSDCSPSLVAAHLALGPADQAAVLAVLGRHRAGVAQD